MATETKRQEKVAEPELIDAETGEILGQPIVSAAVRLPYYPSFKKRYGIDQPSWKVLVDAIFPSATTTDSVMMALAYCKQRDLDPFKRVVHIVPMWSKAANGGKGGMLETIWPGIAELRTTAFRTGDYGGIDTPEFGPMVETTFTDDKNTVKVKHPEWCRHTVYRFVRNHRVAFVGPKTVWMENYATISHFSDVPNSMWKERPEGQLEKVSEAGALRRAFPEEIGGQYAAEEMEGKIASGDIGGVPVASAPKPETAALEPPSPPEETPRPTIQPPSSERSEAGGARANSTGAIEQPPDIPVELQRPAPVKLPAFPGTEDPEKFRAYVDKMLSAATTIDGLQDTYNAHVEPHIGALFPPDREDVFGLYAKHEKRFEP